MMRLFKRGPSEPEIDDFWAWWPAKRRIKVDFATGVAWSFQKALGVR